MRLIFFLPSGVTDSTTSTLFPQLLQHCALLFAPARAETSVFDFPFSAILLPPFPVQVCYQSFNVFCSCSPGTQLSFNCILLDGKSRAGTDDTTEENHKLNIIIQYGGILSRDLGDRQTEDCLKSNK
jgi:hypothetical protein